jgi:hypothetical protein
MSKKVIATIIVTLLIIAGLVGIAGLGYRMGMNEGIRQSPQIAEQMQQWRNAPPQANPAPGLPPRMGPMMGRGDMRGNFGPMMGYNNFGNYRGMRSGPFSLIGAVVRFLLGVFFVLLIIAAIRWIFFGRRMGWAGWRNHGGSGQHWGPPPWFDEWHKRAHEPSNPTTTTSTPAEKPQDDTAQTS